MRNLDHPPPGSEAPSREDGDQAVQLERLAQGVRRERQHIEDLDGEDPLRGGVAD